MTDADLERIEKELGLKLPASYRRALTQFPVELRDWPLRDKDAGYDRREDFLLDAAAIIAANQAARKKFRKRFPPGAFVYGGDSKDYWLIDCSQPNPPVQLINKDYLLDGWNDLEEHLAAVRQAHEEAWARARKRTRAGPRAELSAEELIAEGRRLARPAYALYDTGRKYAAVWRGSGVVSPGAGERRHWISIDTQYLPENPRNLTGVISVYEDRAGEVQVVHGAEAQLPRKTDGTKLYAKSVQCVPDVDAVFQFGSKKIKDWAKLNPTTSYERSPVKEYLQAVRDEHPFSSRDGAYAMLGGWSWCFMWCYSIDEPYPWRLLKGALVVLTLAESEPWIEVFDDGRKFVAFSRIT